MASTQRVEDWYPAAAATSPGTGGEGASGGSMYILLDGDSTCLDLGL